MKPDQEYHYLRGLYAVKKAIQEEEEYAKTTMLGVP